MNLKDLYKQHTKDVSDSDTFAQLITGSTIMVLVVAAFTLFVLFQMYLHNVLFGVETWGGVLVYFTIEFIIITFIVFVVRLYRRVNIRFMERFSNEH